MSKLLILLVFTVSMIGCSKNESSGNSQSAKVLDTSFLKLNTPGHMASSNKIEKNDKVIILEENQKVDLQTTELSVTNFDMEDLTVGSIIVGNSDDKVLLEVTDITDVEATNKVNVKQADISSIASPSETNSFSYSITPDIQFGEEEDANMEIKNSESNANTSDGSSKLRESGGVSFKGNEVNFNKFNIVNIQGDISSGLKGRSFSKKAVSLNGGAEGSFKVDIEKGFVKFLPTFNGDYEFSYGKVKKLENTFNALVKYKFVVKVKSDQKMSASIGRNLFKDIKFPVTIPGPVPVYMDFIIKFPVGIKVSVADKSETTFTFSGEYALKADMIYTDVDGMKFDKQTDNVVREKTVKNDKTDGVYQAEFFFEPKIQAKLYKVVGPYAYLNTSLMAELDLPLKENRDDLFANLSGGVGVTISEPIFDKELLNLKSPTLFNITRGFDVVGPTPENIKVTDEFTIKDTTLAVNTLDNQNGVALKLRPDSLSSYGKVFIGKYPKLGVLVLDKHFSTNGLAYYHPKKSIKGDDSFSVFFQEGKSVSKAMEIKLELSQSAKDQAKNSNQFSLTSTSIDHLMEVQTKEEEIMNIISIPYEAFMHRRIATCTSNCPSRVGGVDDSSNEEENIRNRIFKDEFVTRVQEMSSFPYSRNNINLNYSVDFNGKKTSNPSKSRISMAKFSNVIINSHCTNYIECIQQNLYEMKEEDVKIKDTEFSLAEPGKWESFHYLNTTMDTHKNTIMDLAKNAKWIKEEVNESIYIIIKKQNGDLYFINQDQAVEFNPEIFYDKSKNELLVLSEEGLESPEEETTP